MTIAAGNKNTNEGGIPLLTKEEILVLNLKGLQNAVNTALKQFDNFGSVSHSQGLAQSVLSDIKLKLDKTVFEYSQLEIDYVIPYDNSR